ncbi:glucosamine 6-phosphate N-acetyltransferase isoform X1 [Selaginella moellendorffii]|uniref:glucosamine 6-phosphate N-acetyltransferase isoform X1 n=1 Tax=Selaginella moellendorffii TaxID=88036 RepID=UPI000D1CB5FD|nr:glucosamine 6-phosphate N-acetyltransferase isoform X1 [Selaginella moellendorffii]|eukprot:XP_024525267.1 glucosamine 6-phosphate N-acetyltransferase isoform X1 [Selaginella moellendorffii]
MEGLELRRLERGDFDKGFLQLMQQLTVVGDVSREMFDAKMQQLEKLGDYHRIVVIEDVKSGRVVATGSIFIEHKFARSCGKVGHLEDVVVDERMRGCHLGQRYLYFALSIFAQQSQRRVIEALTSFAKDAGCYKVILDCKPENAAFYEKCGYSKKEIQMAKYF